MLAAAARAELRQEQWREQEARHNELCGKSEGYRKKQSEESEDLRSGLQGLVNADPSAFRAVTELREFLERWLHLQEGYPDIPIDKLWASHLANNPGGAVCYGARVDLSQHLPRAVSGCLTPCRVCDQHESLGNRQIEWERAQRLLREQHELEEQRKKWRAEAERRAKAEAWEVRRRQVEEQVAAARAAQRAQEEREAREQDPVEKEVRRWRAAKEANPNLSIDDLD